LQKAATALMASVTSTKLLQGHFRELHHYLNQAPQYRENLVYQVQVGLHFLVELESGERQVDLVDRIF
jgi:hypothetical protein